MNENETGPLTTTPPSLQSREAEHSVHPGIAEWDRRHRATERMAPIDDDGTVDPWLKDIRNRPPLTNVQVDGAVAAAEHLLSHGLTPVFDLDVLRAMWRRHGDCGLAVR